MTLCGPICRHLLKFSAIGLVAAAAFAQAPPKYDPASETTLKGVVDQMKLVPPSGGKPVAYLVMKGDDAAQVFLCPKKFLDDMGVDFKTGDEIQIIGSKIKHEGADLILAREVAKGGDTLTLRFKDGKPAW